MDRRKGLAAGRLLIQVKRFKSIAGFAFLAAVVLMVYRCGGTWVDDSRNFERAFGFKRPPDVQVIRSIFWKSRHFTYEFCYFVELQPSEGSRALKWLTTRPDVAPVVDGGQYVFPNLILKRPEWFAPGPLSAYDIWTLTKEFGNYGVLRDKQQGRLFVYGQIL